MKRIVSMLLCAVLLLTLCPAAFAANSDYAAYYLSEYQVQAGDTLSSICESRSIQYAEYATIIKNLNGITNPNALVAGRKYWIPTKQLGDCERYYTVYRHVLVSGDTISGLCTTYGTNYNSVSTLIQNLNGVTNLNNFIVGTNVYLPVPSAALAEAAKTGSAAASGTTATTGTTATAVTPKPATPVTTVAAGTESTVLKGDYVAFYITPYVCQLGDTLNAICQRRGVNYANYKKLILSLNKLASETSLIAGISYWMPSSSVGSATVYYTVYRHLLVTGDTMYALCNAYGINMNKYTDLILKLNDAKSLTGFQAGKNILLPVYHDGSSTGSGTAAVIETATLDESQAGVGSSVVTTKTGTDAGGNPVTETITTSTTVQEAPGLFDAMSVGTYYLVPHTVAAGESLISICNELGSSFSKNKNLIVGANGLKSYSLPVGSNVYIPVASQGEAAKYYKVTVKTIDWGDTVYGYYCNLNADFSVNYKMLTALNENLNFNNLIIGNKVSIPVLVG